jgi:hypothetical protein
VITITGTNLGDTSVVLVGGTPAQDITVDSNTQVTITTPPNDAGTVDITATTPDGTSPTSSNDQLTLTGSTGPDVTGLSLTSGSTSGGDVLAITGTNFTGTNTVSFGGTPALDFQVIGDTAILVYDPPHDAGTVDVTVTTPDGTSATSSSDQFTYVAPSAPTLTSVSTSTGTSSGGTLVTLTGTNLGETVSVSFGGIPATNFTVNSPTSVTAVAPPQATGTYDITLTTTAGTTAIYSSGQFTVSAGSLPSVTSLSLTGGTSAGGTGVVITGSNFIGASGVLFGGVPADDFTVVSDTEITATAPPQAAGTVDVTVTAPAGTSATSTSDQFTYSSASAPTVTAVTQNSGSTGGGATVVLSGTDFGGATDVSFGGTDARGFTVDSPTQITAVAPPHASGTVNVTVTTYAGTSATGTANQFTYNAASAPAVTALTPAAGSTLGGDAVTLTGTNFSGASAVSFGGTDAPDFEVLDDNTIFVVSPAVTAAGTVDVTVTTPSGTSSAVSADHFAYSAPSAPAVTGLSATSGGTGGGTTVVIAGSGFTAATQVTFGGTAVYDFNVDSDTQLTVLAPPHAAGTWDVTVTTPAGTSALNTSDRFTYSAASAPTVTALGTTSGSSAGGTGVTITGTDFTGAGAVSFGSTPALDFQVLSATTVFAVAPPQAAGTVDVRVTTPTGTSAVATADQFTYSAATAPAVTGLSPSTGTTAGGTLVTITGTHFTGAGAVSFGTVAADDFQVLSDTTILAAAPHQAAGTVDITVTTPSGTSSAVTADHFVYSAASAPAVTAVGPSSGGMAGGDVVTLLGSNFTGATGVSFGTAAALDFTVVSDSAIVAVAPYHAAGTVHVTVTTDAGTSSTGAADQYTYSYVSAPAPAVTAVAPSSGTTAGGTTVVISGTNLTGATAVAFGGTSATFTVNGDGQITATAPAGSAGSVDITVTTPGGTSSTSSADQFTYVAVAVPAVTALGTSTGSTAGGTSVTITGTNFSNVSAVSFGGVAAAYTVASSSLITATAPAQATGTVDVTVTTASGTSATSSSDQFTYTAASAPAVTSLGTTTGSTGGGTSVTITGTNLAGAYQVLFGEAPAAFTVNSSTSITATAPAQAAGTVDVTVSTYSGTSAPTSGDRFTYTAASAPAVTGLSPSSGSTGGGTSVAITGTNFLGTTAVFFGTLAADSFTVNSDTSITAAAPAQAAGTVDVTVTTYSGTSAVATADHFTYTAASAPAVTAVSPTGGSTAGGTSVTITGTDLLGASAVSFGTVAATFTVNSSTLITATAPSQAAGTVDITVTTPSGTSATGSADHFTYTAASAPAVTALSPSSGSTSGGTVVTLLGSNFTGASAVSFGSTAALWFTVNSDSSLTALAPAGTGTVDVTVTTPSGTSSTGTADQFTYSAPSAPTVTALDVSSGSTAGGTVVKITGSHFTEVGAVYFGGTAAADFTVNSDTQITALTPAHEAGTWEVTVTAPAGTSAVGSANRFTFSAASAPAVTGLSASSGSTAGGTAVTITGTDFGGVSQVLFGLTPAAGFTPLSATSVLAVAPAGAAGTVDVRVVTSAGTSAPVTADHFTYTAASAPTVTGVSPSSGSTAGGTVVTITGTNLGGVADVSFGSVAALSFTQLSATSLQATAPAQAAGTVDVRVTTAAGTSATATADHFTYSAASAPAVTGVTPSTGGTTGGTVVTITGTNLGGVSGVSFGSVAATAFTVLSPTALRATAPAQAAGTVDIRVTTPSGTSSAVTADHFTYSAAGTPTVTGLGTSSGGTGGGTVVTVTGTNLAGALLVSFGGVPALSFAAVSGTTLIATAPPHAAGTVNVLVTTSAGTSAAGTGNQFTYNAASAPTVTGLGLTAGQSGGGDVVMITGTNFTGGSGVSFGTAAATAFTVLSATSIRATAPPHAAGTVDVTVTTAAGTSATGTADHFTYSAATAPSVTGLGLASGSTAGATLVLVQGLHLSGASAVNFGSVAAGSFTVLSDTLIAATAPGQGSGAVYVQVVTPSGTSSTGSANQYTYVAPSAPYANEITPNYGPSAGGGTIVLLGGNLLGATAVQFDTTSTTFTVYSDSLLTAVIPAHSIGGVYVTVTTAAGTSAAGTGNQYIYMGGPQVAAGGAVDEEAAGAPLTRQELQPVLDEAVARWEAAGVDAAGRDLLRHPDVRVADLAGDYLGLTWDGTVWIDPTAAGHGWFIDPTPADDSEFPAVAGSPAAGRMDLLTVVTHELGHVLGLDDVQDESDIMGEALPAGVRRLPTAADALATSTTLLVHLSAAPAPGLPALAVAVTAPGGVASVGGLVSRLSEGVPALLGDDGAFPWEEVLLPPGQVSLGVAALQPGPPQDPLAAAWLHAPLTLTLAEQALRMTAEDNLPTASAGGGDLLPGELGASLVTGDPGGTGWTGGLGGRV